MIFNLFKTYPNGFKELFVLQVCSNFSFFGLKAFFVLYAITQFSFSSSEAISLFAAVMTLSYASSLLGGWISDNSLGIKNTILLGGLLEATGFFFFLFSSPTCCFLSLALITLGAGLIKPTLSASVGLLFADSQDPEKDKAYSTFYIAMNVGGFLGPLLCSVINNHYGFYYSILLVLAIFIGGLFFFYKGIRFNARREALISTKRWLVHPLIVSVGTLLLLVPFYVLLKYHDSFHHLMGAIALGSILYIGKLFYESPSAERKALLIIVFYILLFTFFCALFEQVGSSLMLFFDTSVDRHVMGFEFSPSVFLSLGPIFVLLCSPPLIFLLEKFPLRGLLKIGIGFLLTGLSFAILAFACLQGSGLISSSWVVGAILVQTIGELLIVPIGFSAISQLSPPHLRTLMMSFWMMAIAYGHYFGGCIAKFSVGSVEGAVPSLDHYQMFFNHLAFMPAVVAVLILLYCFFTRRITN